jgi:hypothetical protein
MGPEDRCGPALLAALDRLRDEYSATVTADAT